MMVSLMAGHFIDFSAEIVPSWSFHGPRVCIASDENWASGASVCVCRDHVLVARGVKSKVYSELRVGARANCIIKQAANESESHSSGRRPFIITVIPIVERRDTILFAAHCATTNHAKSGLKSVNS
jgi:hypothetical protein